MTFSVALQDALKSKQQVGGVGFVLVSANRCQLDDSMHFFTDCLTANMLSLVPHSTGVWKVCTATNGVRGLQSTSNTLFCLFKKKASK